MLTFDHQYILEKQKIFEGFSKNYFSKNFATSHLSEKNKVLIESMLYSFNSGGKRFRPVLSMLAADVFNVPEQEALNFALAIEMVHTYSLIHDDLPCMDNDDYRRSQLTNHKVYGDDIALLAGDAWLTEAFQCIASCESTSLEKRIQQIQLLSQSAGHRGMVLGQVIDMKVDQKTNISDVQQIHILKTGLLIMASISGVSLLSRMDHTDQMIIKQFGQNLGLAFQIKDDLLDENDRNQDFKSYLSYMNKNSVIAELENVTMSARKELNTVCSKYNFDAKPMLQILDYNLNRNK